MSFGKNILSSMIGTTLALLISGGVLIIFLVAAMVGGFVDAFGEIEGGSSFDADIESGSVLHLTFDDGIVERGLGQSFTVNFNDFSPEKTMGLNDLLADLERAAADENIVGILLEVNGVGGYPSTLGEVRKGLLKFKESGKWIVSWSETQSQKAYWLCSVADEMLLHPEGMAEMFGLNLETTYLTGLLEKLGVEMQVLRGPNNLYKSAVEPYTRKSMSEPNREQLTALLEDFWSEMRSDIASSRDLKTERLDEIANGMLLRSAQTGIDLGLYDALMYEDELVAMLEEKGVSTDSDDELELVSFSRYHNPNAMGDMFAMAMLALEDTEDTDDTKDDKESETDDVAVVVDATHIAVVYAVGGIQSGEGDDQTIGSARIAQALRDARLDPEVGAVVLRVNSPGGSALASDVIWRETVKLREAGKPVVASMSDLAASGGYYISCAADKILCQPNTITGSIGVFGMIPNMNGLLEGHLGLRYDNVKLHDHADMFSSHSNLDTEERVVINGVISDIYDDFISRVAEGRGMTISEVDEVARGRVWTGQDALEIGLVDGFGGLQEAVKAAAELASMSNYELVELPEVQDPFEAFMKDLIEVKHATVLQELVGLTDADLAPLQQVQEILNGDRYQSRLLLNFNVN
jgi:protease-4